MTSIEASDRNRLICSGLISGAFWLVVVLLMIFAPVRQSEKKVPQFTSIKLTLRTTVSPVKSAALAVKAAGIVPSTAAVPANPALTEAAPAAASTPAARSATGKQPAAGAQTAAAAQPHAATRPAAGVQPEAARKPSGLGIPNFSTPVTPTGETTGSGEFLDFTSTAKAERTAPPASPKGGTPTAEFEGAAASVTAPTSGARTSSASKSGTGTAGTASAETQSVLGQIAGAASVGTVSPGMAQAGTASGKPGGSSAAAASSAVTGLSFDGIPRKLISPADPSIVLPENLARLVDSDRAVTVSFTVRADGTVPVGLISFSPSAILPAEIRDWLRKEFSGWRFEKSTEDGQARFLYSIKVE